MIVRLSVSLSIELTKRRESVRFAIVLARMTLEEMPMELIEQLAADRDIRQLIARYAQLADAPDSYAFAALFTADGVLTMPSMRCVGHVEIEQWLRKTLAAGKTRHLFMNPLLELISPAKATGCTDMLALRASDSG